MLRSMCRLACALVASFALVGCGGAPEREIVEVQPPTPLTVDEWKAMEDIQLKYDPLSYERLQLNDPKLKSEAAWKKFETEVIAPEFKKDHAPSN